MVFELETNSITGIHYFDMGVPVHLIVFYKEIKDNMMITSPVNNEFIDVNNKTPSVSYILRWLTGIGGGDRVKNAFSSNILFNGIRDIGAHIESIDNKVEKKIMKKERDAYNIPLEDISHIELYKLGEPIEILEVKRGVPVFVSTSYGDYACFKHGNEGPFLDLFPFQKKTKVRLFSIDPDTMGLSILERCQFNLDLHNSEDCKAYLLNITKEFLSPRQIKGYTPFLLKEL